MRKHLSIKIIQTIVSLVFAGFLLNSQVKAEVVIGYKFELNLQDGPGSIGKLVINIDDQDENKIVDTYEITIPISGAENIKVSLSGNEENNFTVTDVNGYKKLNVTFEAPILPKESKSLVIQFTSPTLLRSSYGLKQLYIQNPFENLTKNIDYLIEYPKNFGNIYRTFDSQKVTEKETTDTLELESTNGVYIIWADEIKVNLKNSIKIRNDDSSEQNFFYSLPQASKKQHVYFNEIKNVTEAFSDKYNLFGDISIGKNELKEVGYSADIIIKDVDGDSGDWPDKYNYTFNTESAFGREVLESIKGISDNYEKLKIFNQILRNNANPNKQASISSQQFNNLWDKFEGDRTLNSYEYAAISVSFAEYLGLRARLEYGYLILSPTEMDLTRPQVWAVIDVDGNDVFTDQFMEDVSNISYFDTNYIDRINFGVWHPSQTYNPASGLAYNGSSIKVQASAIEEKEYENNFDLDLTYPDSTSSGNFYTAVMNINNKSSMALDFESLKINDNNFLEMIRSGNGLYPVILPGQTKSINIENVRETNIFYNAEQNVQTKVEFHGVDEILKEDKVKFYIDPKNVIMFAAIFTLLVSVLGFLYLKIRNAIN